MSQVYFEDVEPGYELIPLIKEPTREQLDEFTRAWGTSLGRFTSDEAARAEGGPGLAAATLPPGRWTGFCVSMAGRRGDTGTGAAGGSTIARGASGSTGSTPASTSWR